MANSTSLKQNDCPILLNLCVCLLCQTQFALVINTLGIMHIEDETLKEATCAPTHHSTRAGKREGLATHPPTHSSKSGLILIAPIFAWSWACPRPERFSIPYYHIINNNTQGRILHYQLCCPGMHISVGRSCYEIARFNMSKYKTY